MASRSSFGQVTTLRSGRHQARYAVPGSRPTRYVNAPTTFARKKDANDWLAKQRADIVDGVIRSTDATASRVTFGEYAEEWMATRRNSKGEALRASTRRTYQLYLKLHVLPVFGSTPLGKITRAMVKSWYADLCPNAPTVRARTYSLVRTILNTAVDEDGLLRENPCRIRGASVSPARAKTHVATPEQVDELAAELPEHLALTVLLGAWCQLRNGEALELRRGDIVGDAESVYIARGVTYAEGGEAVIGPPKTTAGVRGIAIPPHIRPAVREHLARFGNPGADGLLFPVRPGVDEHLKQQTYSYIFKQAVRRTSLPGTFRFHWLRHTGLTLAAQAGATLAELMGRAGHSTASTVMRYQHATSLRDQKIAEALSEAAKVPTPVLTLVEGGAEAVGAAQSA